LKIASFKIDSFKSASFKSASKVLRESASFKSASKVLQKCFMKVLQSLKCPVRRAKRPTRKSLGWGRLRRGLEEQIEKVSLTSWGGGEGEGGRLRGGEEARAEAIGCLPCAKILCEGEPEKASNAR
jgi:hypothetical protein